MQMIQLFYHKSVFMFISPKLSRILKLIVKNINELL